MPPVFGILLPGHQTPDKVITGRMMDKARYYVARRLATRNLPGLWAAAAMIRDNGENDEKHVFSESGNLFIVADASLYNHGELAHRLGDDPSAKNAGEAELILRAYVKWGDQCLKYLYGDFAFAIFNTETGGIFCGRDPMGVRPFYYMLHENTFVFSSELRAVSGSLKNSPEPDEDYLPDSLTGVKSPRHKSPFKNIFRLPPAHYLTCKNGEIKTTRYWLPDVETTISRINEEEYIYMFRELLVNAVNMRCKGVHSLGTELSGGLDSSAVTGIAADHAAETGIPLKSFSNVFPEGTPYQFNDEREFILDMREFKKLNGLNIDRLGLPVIELLQSTMEWQGIFVQQNYNVFNYGLLKAAGEEGIDVLLSGFGGDELVSARVSMPWNELISDRQWRVIRDELYYGGITPRSLLKPGLITARYLYSLMHRPEYRTGVFTPELLGKRINNLPLNAAYLEKHHLEKRFRDKYKTPYQDRLSARQLLRINMEHIPQRMEYCYSSAAQFGTEYRYPLLDVNLMLACLAFPPWVKQHHGINRYLFRQAIAGFVPESIRQRDDKSGSTIPHTFFSLNSEKEHIMNVIRDCSRVPFLQEIFDFSRFSPWYEKLVARDEKDLNYLNPGAFYTYLMIMMYYRNRDEGHGTRDEK